MARYGMVIDLTRCSGCQTCVITCQMHHNTRPGIAWGKVETVEIGAAWPDVDRVIVPHACMHCDDAPCVAACPTGASVQREDGIVTVDYETCIGCGACVTACPFGARQIGAAENEWFFGAEEPAPYESYGTQRAGVAEKCVFCFDRVDEGKAPWCVDACPPGARIFGDLDDPDSEICAYIEANGAEQIPGTSVYYVKGGHDLDLPAFLMGTATAEADAEAEPATDDAKDGE